jgi:prephenate dehydratase
MSAGEGMRVAIQGEFGSFSHEAALKLVPKATIVPCKLSADVFELVEQKGAAAVIPIENSLAGSVVEHFDLLFQRDVQVHTESMLRIRHNLIGMPGSKLDQIERAFSHPVALAQCRRFLAVNPKIAATPAYDTAGGVKQVMEAANPRSAAIASLQAAKWYGGEVLAADIEDDPANYTRFFLIQKAEGSSAWPAGADKLSTAFILENRPGTLLSVLEVFARHHTNLNKIESRPVKGKPWEYIFYVDCQISDPQAARKLLEELGDCCLVVKNLGFYPAAAAV